MTLICPRTTAKRHVAPYLGERVRRQGHALRRADRRQLLRCLGQLRLEAADAQPGESPFHSVDDPRLLASRVLAFAARPLGILLLECRNCHHAAVLALAPERPPDRDFYARSGQKAPGGMKPGSTYAK